MNEEKPAQDTLTDGLNARHEQLLAELLIQPNIATAAKNCGIPERTAREWFHKNEAFKARYREARREMVESPVKLATSVSRGTVQLMWEMVQDPAIAPHVRLAAMEKLVNIGRRGFETLEVALRLEEVEEQQAETQSDLDKYKGGRR